MTRLQIISRFKSSQVNFSDVTESGNISVAELFTL